MSNFGRIVRLVKEIKELNTDPEIAAKLQEIDDVEKNKEKFLESICEPLSPLQKKIYEDTLNEPWLKNFEDGKTQFHLRPIMISGHLEGNLLKMVAEVTAAKRILDIGMYTGFSAVSFAETSNCESVTTLEMEPYLETFLKSRIAGTPVEKKIHIMIGNAMESLEKLKSGHKFDLVFIDADKPGYINYYKFIMDNDMLAENGVFLCDNIFWGTDTFMERQGFGGKALYEFATFVKNDDRVMEIIIPIRDGVLLIKRKPVIKSCNGSPK